MKRIGIVLGVILLNITFCAICVAEEKNKSEVLAETVVTATKYEVSIKDIPAPVTIITSAEIEKQNLPNSDIGDVLRRVTGITLRRAYAPFPAYPNIRGAGSGVTAVLINGIVTNWEITQAISPGNIERIEIIRGPVSALYGANASGGVINIVMKEGEEGFTGNVGSGYGTFNTYRSSIATSGAKKKFHFSLAAFKEKSDGAKTVTNNIIPAITMIDGCEYDKFGISLNTNYNLSNTKVSFFYNFFNNDYTRGRPYVGGEWDRHFTGIIYDQSLGDRFTFKASLGYRYDDLLHLYDKGGSNYQKNRKRFTNYSEIPIELQLITDLGWGHTLTTGIFYNNQTTKQKYFDWETGSLWRNNEYKVRTKAIFFQDVWKPVNKFVVTTGLRYDFWNNYGNYFSNFTGLSPKDRTDDNWSPSLGVRYNFLEESSVWVNYGMGFKPPTPTQLYDDRTMGGNPRKANPDLRPEKNHSYELGLEQWFGDNTKAQFVGFYSFTDDKITSWFDEENIWVNQNIGKTKSFGIEFEVYLYPLENWEIYANYTWNIAKVDTNPAKPSQEGNFLPFSPEHKVNVGISYEQRDNFTASVFARYLSRQQTNNDNTEYTSSQEERFMDESFVIDLKLIKHFQVSWDHIKKINLSLSVDNVFDEEYRTLYIYEDPGRVFFAEITLFF